MWTDARDILVGLWEGVWGGLWGLFWAYFGAVWRFWTWFRTRDPEDVKNWVSVPLLLVGIAWGGYQFWYKEILVPRKRPASLDVAPTLEEVARRGRYAIVRARVHIANHSESRVWLPVLQYAVMGFRFRSMNLTDSAYTAAVGRYAKAPPESLYEFKTIARHSAGEGLAVLAVWREPVLETFFDPNGGKTYETMFYVPTDRYDAVLLDIDFWESKTVEDIATVDWEATSYGALKHRLYLKSVKYPQDSKYVEVFDGKNPRHATWAAEAGAGAELTRAMLLLSHDRPSVRRAIQ